MYNKDIEFKFNNKVVVFEIKEGGISWIDNEKMEDTIHFEIYSKNSNGELNYNNSGIFYNRIKQVFKGSIEEELGYNYAIAFDKMVGLKSNTFKKIYNKCLLLKKKYDI